MLEILDFIIFGAVSGIISLFVAIGAQKAVSNIIAREQKKAIAEAKKTMDGGLGGMPKQMQQLAMLMNMMKTGGFANPMEHTAGVEP